MSREGLSTVSLVVLAGLVAVAFVQEHSVTVGVLDRKQCGDEDRPPDTVVGVRALFTRTSSGWRALDTTDLSRGQSHYWTVAFDGRNLGSLASANSDTLAPTAWSYHRDHYETVSRSSSIPHVRNALRAFAGWCSSPPERPLVVVSEQNFRDPEAWHPFSPAPSYRQALFRLFQASVDSAIICPGGGERTARWRFRSTDLRLRKSYRSNQHQELVAIQLDPGRNACDGPPGDEYAVHWFRVDSDTALLGIDLELLDAGDYDADGHSEVIFWHSGYNEDGYSLFYDRNRRSVNFWWHYH